MRTEARRVLICEDSRTYAAGLSALLARDRDIDVVGVCETAEQAIARLPGLRPDLLTMDLELPGMPGVSAIEQIMAVRPLPILVLSAHVKHGSQNALHALAAGALDAMPKVDFDVSDLDGAAAQALRQRVRILSDVTVIRHPRARLKVRSRSAYAPRQASVIGICASTGGPPALASVLAGVPADFPIPILVVQHIAAGFAEGFARWLDGEVPLPVRLAQGGEPPVAGVAIAREGADMLLAGDGRIEFDAARAAGPHRPSGDALLSSLADVAGPTAAAIVLTGMGRDGADGLGEVRAAGGLTIAQDEASSAVFGMPRAAAESGAEYVLALDRIAELLRALQPAFPVR
jgi:two-component system, chemotaxis family, protein-glutamate methylesterase/glutaminase